jgi:hypothetical protein
MEGGGQAITHASDISMLQFGAYQRLEGARHF